MLWFYCLNYRVTSDVLLWAFAEGSYHPTYNSAFPKYETLDAARKLTPKFEARNLPFPVRGNASSAIVLEMLKKHPAVFLKPVSGGITHGGEAVAKIERGELIGTYTATMFDKVSGAEHPSKVTSHFFDKAELATWLDNYFRCYQGKMLENSFIVERALNIPILRSPKDSQPLTWEARIGIQYDPVTECFCADSAEGVSGKILIVDMAKDGAPPFTLDDATYLTIPGTSPEIKIQPLCATHAISVAQAVQHSLVKRIHEKFGLDVPAHLAAPKALKVALGVEFYNGAPKLTTISVHYPTLTQPLLDKSDSFAEARKWLDKVSK